MSTPPNLPQGLIDAAAPYLHPEHTRWWRRDVTRSYGGGWPVSGFYWLIDKQNRSLHVIEQEGRFTALAGPQALGLASELLRSQPGQPWERLGLAAFARTLVAWLRDPRVALTDATFYRQPEFILESWLAGPSYGLDALRQLQREPELQTHADGRWTLQFTALNHVGGAEAWEASGQLSPFSVSSLQPRELVPAGGFYFPDEL